MKAHLDSHSPPSNTVQGEETSQGEGGRVKTPLGIKFDGATSEKSADGAGAPNGGHPHGSRFTTIRECESNFNLENP
jgi:hypothetical protein